MKINKYHDSGELLSETPLNHKGYRHGIEKGWFRDGQLCYERSFCEGQEHGVARGWYQNGQLRYEQPYHQEQRHGIFKGWYENGQFWYKDYYLYNNEVTEEEYRRHELIVKLSGLT